MPYLEKIQSTPGGRGKECGSSLVLPGGGTAYVDWLKQAVPAQGGPREAGAALVPPSVESPAGGAAMQSGAAARASVKGLRLEVSCASPCVHRPAPCVHHPVCTVFLHIVSLCTQLQHYAHIFIPAQPSLLTPSVASFLPHYPTPVPCSSWRLQVPYPTPFPTLP